MTRVLRFDAYGLRFHLQGFCPSEDKCTNQMFTKKSYASLEIVSLPGLLQYPMCCATSFEARSRQAKLVYSGMQISGVL
jgi:hypothetical protein